MKKTLLSALSLAFISSLQFTNAQSFSQDTVSGSSDNLIAQDHPDRSLIYNINDDGIAYPMIWGLDLAWLSESNVRRGVEFMSEKYVDVIRSSFIPTDPLVGDTALQGDALSNTNERLNIIKNYAPSHAMVTLNCDHPSVDETFTNSNQQWANLIEVTAKMHKAIGRKVITVSPFNEPDYGWGQGSMQDFYDIATILRQNSYFDTIRISGGNTLSNDAAYEWYSFLQDVLDEGNTHQLAGSFDTFAAFYEAVRANGDHATGDELHNVMEGIVGAEYGMQTAIWWGTAEYARGEFVKATHGTRLAYAEHRPNWSAAAVYRNPEGKIQAFGGESERQAATTLYRYISEDREVYYDGVGPSYEYVLEIPGGTGYQVNQPNAERVINISYGEDIQPIIKGKYAIVNRKSGKVMSVINGGTDNGSGIVQSTYTGEEYQQWNVTPVDTRIGGDFSYFNLKAVHSGQSPDIYNWSIEDNGDIKTWDFGGGSNQQYFLEYAEDGWFYIRSRHSGKCVTVYMGSSAENANINQLSKKDADAENQMWRFVPVDADIEFVAPSAPTELSITPNTESVLLTWTASPEEDVAGYEIYRATESEGAYEMIARNVTNTAFVDNKTVAGTTYFYKLKAIDKTLNKSEYSSEASAASTGEQDLVVNYDFETSTKDSTLHLNHGAASGTTTYTIGKVGDKSLNFNGSNTFVQLPARSVQHKAITVAFWTYWRGGSAWQRFFDFGNGTDQYLFLTPKSGDGDMRFVIKNGGDEQVLSTTVMTAARWTHLAITLDENGVYLYKNGALVASTQDITINPMDFEPKFNFIGRSQYADPLYTGFIDDFRVYNYALSEGEVADLADLSSSVDDVNGLADLSIYPVPAQDLVYLNFGESRSEMATVNVYDMGGSLVLSKNIAQTQNSTLNTSALSSGIYLMKVTTGDATNTRKLVIKR